MEQIEQRVTRVLESAFKDVDVNLEVMPSGRISGTVIWAGFDKLDDIERQRMIRDLLQRELGPEAVMVGVLLAYTPDELEAMSAA